ncbi:hypothetical protein I6F50_14330 [Pseudoalteromonas sp. NZS127_1]|uniref:hypothetical protein n=1 Tax=unclassified Pseudoalteromonas TaxID=194690 RepID=UPI0018CDDDEC|nr:hypothetical protein [Pseudoalteromonas sp. NZS127_1]MBH0014350.1 hypothetical protein [Pseudoalteromonas sp. NZS100_1]MBH0039373.1 hypothetical protein [Pseudoalteromonas sp. SWN166]
MSKGNAWPWVISLCIHAIVLYFLFSQSINVAPPKEEKSAIIQAYVTVNLASLPKPSSIVTTTNAPDIKPVNTKTDAPNAATSNTTPIKKDSTKAKVKVTKKTQAKTTTLPQAQTELKKEPVKPVEPQLAAPSEPTTKVSQTFKKLNPYAPLFGSPVNNMTHKKMVSFGEDKSSENDEINNNPTIKTPVKSANSEVISQNTAGTRRLEKFNGKCYLIDTSTVFGSNGMPQGSGKPCPEDKTDKEIMFEKIMEKWSRKNN